MEMTASSGCERTIAEPVTLTVRCGPEAGSVAEDWPSEGKARARATPKINPRIPHRNRGLTEPPLRKGGPSEHSEGSVPPLSCLDGPAAQAVPARSLGQYAIKGTVSSM